MFDMLTSHSFDFVSFLTDLQFHIDLCQFEPLKITQGLRSARKCAFTNSSWR